MKTYYQLKNVYDTYNKFSLAWFANEKYRVVPPLYYNSESFTNIGSRNKTINWNSILVCFTCSKTFNSLICNIQASMCTILWVPRKLVTLLEYKGWGVVDFKRLFLVRYKKILCFGILFCRGTCCFIFKIFQNIYFWYFKCISTNRFLIPRKLVTRV